LSPAGLAGYCSAAGGSGSTSPPPLGISTRPPADLSVAVGISSSPPASGRAGASPSIGTSKGSDPSKSLISEA